MELLVLSVAKELLAEVDLLNVSVRCVESIGTRTSNTI